MPAARGNGQANPQKAPRAKALALRMLADRLEDGKPEGASLPTHPQESEIRPAGCASSLAKAFSADDVAAVPDLVIAAIAGVELDGFLVQQNHEYRGAGGALPDGNHIGEGMA